MKKQIASLIAAVITVAPSLAQQKDSYTNFTDTVFGLNEVTVEAKVKRNHPEILKLNVPAEYIPITTSQVEAPTLQKFGIVNIQDADKFLPGIRVQTSYGGFQQISGRGMDHIPVMIDGMRDERSSINNSYPFMDLSAVESIEYLKGPASVLYGHSAVGGILNVVRKNPTAKKTVNARMAYGSYDKKYATLGMGGKIIEGVNSFVSFNFEDGAGWRNTNNQRFSGYAAMDFKTGEKGKLDLRGGFNRDHYGTEIGLPAAVMAKTYNKDGSLYLDEYQTQPGLNRKARYNNESDFLKNYGWNIMGTYTYTFSEAFRLQNRLGYNKDDINYFSTEELSYLYSMDPIYDHYQIIDKESDTKMYICLDTVQLTYPLRFSHVTKTTSNELEAIGAFTTGSVKHNYVAGYSFTFMDRISYSGYNLGVDVAGPGYLSKVPVNNPHSMGYMTSSFSSANVYRNYVNAIYIHDLIEINDKFKFMLAGRFDHFLYRQTSTLTLDGKREVDMPDRDNFSVVKHKAFTYRAGAVYLPKPEISLYASIGSFFQPIRTVYAPNTIYLDSNGNEVNGEGSEQIFKPQSGYQAEVGARYNFSDKLSVDGSFFYIRKNNITNTLRNYEIQVNGQTERRTVIGQIGNMDSKGFDIEMSYNPIEGLHLATAYTFTDSKLRAFKTNKYFTEDTDKGTRFTLIPKHTFYALASYTIQKGCLKGLGANYSVNYRDEVFTSVSLGLVYPSYWISDLSLTYKLKNGITAGLVINNVFDKEYFNQALFGLQTVPSIPRNYLVSLSYSL